MQGKRKKISNVLQYEGNVQFLRSYPIPGNYLVVIDGVFLFIFLLPIRNRK